MFNILSQITLKVKFLRNEEQHCLLPSLVDDFTCVHSKNALLTHILSTVFSSKMSSFLAHLLALSHIYIYLNIPCSSCSHIKTSALTLCGLNSKTMEAAKECCQPLAANEARQGSKSLRLRLQSCCWSVTFTN